MTGVMKESGPEVSEERLVAVETRMGSPLPADYRKFMLQYNGGAPFRAAFKFQGSKDRYRDSVVRRLFSIYDGHYDNFERYLSWRSHRIPGDMVAIAGDPAGNFVCLGVAGSVTGKVYFWDHEDEQDGAPDFSNMHLIAESFDGFLAGLTEED